ncbi:tetratricopeptide repeat protein [Bartonella sp. B23]
MIKQSITLLIVGLFWLSSAVTVATSAKTAGNSSNFENSLNDIQNASDSDKPFQPLQTGQYDQAYDYYAQGYHLNAFREALKRAEQNDPFAQTLLAQMYTEGYAVPRNEVRAAFWFKRAAKQGEPQAQLRYGLMLFDGNFITQNKELGEEFIRKAAESGVKEAYFYYGELLLYKASHEKQNLPGVTLQSRENESVEQALKWFLKGAALGDSEASFSAAKILSIGTLTRPKDDRNARKLMEIAAQNGHTTAQILLAQWLIEGRGGETDFQRAFHLLLSNATNMVPPAQVSLARLYRDGIGTKGDTVMAAAWYMLAKHAKLQAPDLEMMLEGMNDAELEQARKEATKFLPIF